MTAPALVSFPNDGVWRVGRAPDPLEWRTPPDPVDTASPAAGNRFDSFHGNFSVLYFGTDLRSCYAETLARFRLSPAMRQVVQDDWLGRNWMEAGSIAADWRDSRIIVRVTTSPTGLPFLDAASADTLNAFRESPQISQWLEAFGVADLDLSVVVGKDRRVTRLMSQWAYELVAQGGEYVAGIRYVSRLGANYECWAVFDDTQLVELERLPVLTTDRHLRYIADGFGIVVH